LVILRWRWKASLVYNRRQQGLDMTDIGKTCIALLRAFGFLIALSCAGQSAAQAWTQLAPSGSTPSPRDSHTAVYDAAGNHMIVFGGHSSGGLLNDMWVLSNANGNGGTPAWAQLTPSGIAPPSRQIPTAVYDAAGNRMIVFGGQGNSGNLNDVWVLSNANGSGGTPTWTQLTPSGTAPSVRYIHSAVYDAAGNRMIVFGGFDNYSSFNDVWVLSNANGSAGIPAWTQLTPSGAAPSARYGHTAVYDAAGNRMIVFGGYSGSFLNDEWVLSNANGSGGTPVWTQLAPTGTTPSARIYHTSVYDAVGNRMIVFGGYPGGAYLNDVWALSNANGSGTPVWTQMAPSGAAPLPRAWHTAVYDGAGGRMIVFDGYTYSGYLNDEWVLSGLGSSVNIPVSIDIRPRLAINPISRTAGTVVPVAILSSASFNALTAVNRTSLTFGHAGTEASFIHCNTLGQDVNADGYMDLVCQFNGTLGGFQMGDTTGYLRGTTLQGNTIHGSDAVLILQ
jgi:hypothetical protein